MGSEPTEIWKDGTQIWLNDRGQVHREDGPAIIHPDGRQFWYINNKRHREDGPAAIFPDGRQFWFINRNLHREDGPAAIYPTQKSRYYLHGVDVTIRILDWMERKGLHGDMTPDDMRIFLFEFDITEKTRQYNSNMKHKWV